MNYLTFLQALKYDLSFSNNKFKSVKYFRRDIVSVFVWFLVLENKYANTPAGVEEIIQQIPHEYASRPKILKIINNAVDQNFFFKTNDPSDKRKFIIEPSKQCMMEFEEWAQVFRGF